MSARWKKGFVMVAIFFSTALLLLMLTDTTTTIVQLRSDTLRPVEGVLTQSLLARDKISQLFPLTGAIINTDGVHQENTHTVKVSLVHSYSPQTEKHFREMMIDPVRDEHRIYANSPAILKTGVGEITTVMRIWLDKEIWSMSNQNPHNIFSDNYFYLQKFDEYMRPITQGEVLGIPTPIQWSLGDGPIEPRIFRVNGSVYLTFNTGIFTEDRRPFDTTFLWDLGRSKSLLPYIDGGHPMKMHPHNSMPRDKHWSAIVNDTRLYFTYNLDPLRIIECQLQDAANCHFVHKEGPDDYTFQDAQDSIRGGTPFVLYKYPYYLTVAHGTFFRNCSQPNSSCDGKRVYTTHIIVMTIEPKFKILYISQDIQFPKLTLSVPIVRFRFIERPFFFPVGLMLENDNSIVLGGHVNDHSSFLYRISGISNLVNDAIRYDSLNRDTAGPRLGALHHYTRLSIENTTGFQFNHI